jgi:hypothetical protein
MQDGCVVNIRDSFNASKSHAIEVHFQAQLFDIVGILPGAVMI